MEIVTAILHWLPQVPFVPLATLLASIVAIAIWDSLAKPLGIEQQRWIPAAVGFVSSILVIAQAMHLVWEITKAQWNKLCEKKAFRERFADLSYVEKRLLFEHFVRPGRRHTCAGLDLEMLQQYIKEGWIIAAIGNPHEDYINCSLRRDVFEYLCKNRNLVEIPAST
ncbi:hypothetical protein ETAA8_69590 [Anatilimnocola aggregata]|uniref:Uncharacterized protein n=1 Tax=Anatilimnocola aggregata TaxID=2528021 RepID=A0A517YNK5_9BACT|nr:hypothetical protein [Anatilimnocola aggregata]QDU31799.1 hypothetical protein ETAA8_69590 [Anatilimnocola aggregata]